jgi:hypothetical protein
VSRQLDLFFDDIALVISVSEAARVMDCSAQTVRLLAGAGLLQHRRLGANGERFFRRDEIEQVAIYRQVAELMRGDKRRGPKRHAYHGTRRMVG